MTITGIVVEYNPFHNGHLYHINETRKLTKAEVIIAVMSGPFLQRGEPALVSKWDRAKMALENGADIVFELPYAYAVQQAEIFAFGAVSILNAVGCDVICFGSEDGKILPFENTFSFLQSRETEYENAIRKYIKTGISYPNAQAKAFESLGLSPSATVDLTKPNNILGFNYLKAVHTVAPDMTIATVPRKQAHYHDPTFNDSPIASATSIRRALFSDDGKLQDIKEKVPKNVFDLLEEQSTDFLNWEKAFPYLKYRLLTASAKELSAIYEMEEGLEYRLLREIKNKHSFSEFMTSLKTKRYTWTRLQRLCTHILTNTTKKDMAPTLKKLPISYLRLLGMNDNGRNYLNDYKKQLTIPLYTKRLKDAVPLAELDYRAGEVYQFLRQSINPTVVALENTRQPLLM